MGPGDQGIGREGGVTGSPIGDRMLLNRRVRARYMLSHQHP